MCFRQFTRRDAAARRLEKLDQTSQASEVFPKGLRPSNDGRKLGRAGGYARESARNWMGRRKSVSGFLDTTVFACHDGGGSVSRSADAPFLPH